MYLPKTLIQALRQHPDALVSVVVAMCAFAALLKGAAGWPVIVITFLVLALHHVRRAGGEAHERAVALQKVELAVAKADAMRARHLDLLAQGQPSLPLGAPGPTSQPSRRATE